MGVEQIAALPIGGLAAPSAHLYLWATQKYLRDAFDVLTGWGFRFAALIVWCKRPHGVAMGRMFGNQTEYVLFGWCGGATPPLPITDRNWFVWPRGEHSAKPEAFLDLVEQVSPGPYLELFARRQRLGWDTWGNEALQHVELVS
jgi:N6-adenosine-specific RNA methylase IME4